MRAAVRPVLIAALASCVAACGSPGPRPSSSSASAPGTPAPGFTLTDQFGRREGLSDFRGDVVLLTFVDSRCTTVCPLTAQLMREARSSLGPQAADVRLVAIDANPVANSVADVRRWSERHRMLHRWLFLTGPDAELRRIWQAYGIDVEMHHDDVAHTSVVFVIDPSGDVRTAFPIAARSGIRAEADSLAAAVRKVLPA